MRISKEELVKRANKVLMKTTWNETYPIFGRSKGVYLYGIDSRKYLDFASLGPGSINIGANDAGLNEALAELLFRGGTSCGVNELLNIPAIELAEKLTNIVPGCAKGKVFYTVSGAAALEPVHIFAIHRALQRPAVLAFENGFHGRFGFTCITTSSMTLDSTKVQKKARPLHQIIFPYANPPKNHLLWVKDPVQYMIYVKKTLTPYLKEIGLAVIEFIQGEGGMHPAHHESMQALVQYLQKNGVLVCADEVQTGFGRTGEMFACNYVNPDIVTLAKGIGNGVSNIGITVFREGLDFSIKGVHSGTFGGSTQDCLVALEVINAIENNNLLENTRKMGELLNQMLDNHFSKGKYEQLVTQWGGIGLMQKVAFVSSEVRGMVIAEALKQGLFLLGAGGNRYPSVRLMPPLIITEKQLTQGVDILFNAIGKVAENF